MPKICGADCCEESSINEEKRDKQRRIKIEELKIQNNKYELSPRETLCANLFDPSRQYHVYCISSFLRDNIEQVIERRITDPIFMPYRAGDSTGRCGCCSIESFVDQEDSDPSDDGYTYLYPFIYGSFKRGIPKYRYGVKNPPNPKKLPFLPNGINHQFICIPNEWFDQMAKDDWHLHQEIEVLRISFSNNDREYLSLLRAVLISHSELINCMVKEINEFGIEFFKDGIEYKNEYNNDEIPIKGKGDTL